MSSHKLSFGTITILQNNLAEIIVDEGFVMDEVLVDEFHDFLLNNLDTPIGLLINKKNSYSYTFEAQKNIVHLNNIKSIAIVANTSGAVMSTETLININGNIHRNIIMFQEIDAALIWLQKELL
ncbi:MAG: hypothetical protein P8K68_04735 [Algibacter sp.]|uniref:hypothetical protein n=1 Tax=Algibacter sp. TaxID=1872428 RepID=UPI00260E3D43|nr:hypothetical protein [Algibacter sp.]MDG1730342.1 hypothetical protein [Algibacter sp.]MDG2178081.1 hypothetical protein [Algibacter sp.]